MLYYVMYEWVKFKDTCIECTSLKFKVFCLTPSLLVVLKKCGRFYAIFSTHRRKREIEAILFSDFFYMEWDLFA